MRISVIFSRKAVISGKKKNNKVIKIKRKNLAKRLSG